MTAYNLEKRLSDVATRLHRLRGLRRQTVCWLIVIIPAVLLCALLPKSGLPLRRESIALLTAGIVGLLLARWKRSVPTWHETARLVEQHNPSLNDVVLTAVRQRSANAQVSSVLSARVLREADDIARVSDWRSVAPGQQILKWFVLSLASFLLLVSSVLAASRLTDIATRATADPGDSGVAGLASSRTTVTVEPGDTEVELGSSLTVVARFVGGMPSRAAVELQVPSPTQPVDSSAHRLVPMDETVDAGVFAVRVPAIDGNASYRVVFGNSDVELAERQHASDSYHISTFERPRVVQVDAEIQPPAWTRRKPAFIEDTLRIAAIEGSRVTVRVHLNKDVTLSDLIAGDGSRVSLSPADQPFTRVATVDALHDTTWTVDLQDADERSAAEDTQISLRMIPNEPPQIRITFPQPDLSVSALQELVTEAEVSDDFGIVDYGIVYSLSGSEPRTLSLKAAKDKPSVRQAALNHTIALESLSARPNDLLTWHFFADAHVANGKVRRSVSDLMFADVRRFEEIFREGQQQGGQPGEQQGGGQTDTLLQIQRQIAIGIWNVQREVTSAGADADIEDDLNTLLESQELAITQLNEMKEDAADEQEMLDAMTAAGEHMNDVVDALSSFSTSAPGTALNDAGASAQAAFRELLRLRAAEHEVSQSRSSQGGSGQQNSAMQQQLDQLELDNDRNRYETEQQAQQEQQTAEQKEQLQVLSRLKELARRQNLLNERIQQLESELRNATTEEEKKRIERELKRLREEQREMLRDVDELRERMEQSTSRNQPAQQQMREEVDQARENVREASRAMDEGRLSDALSEGKRAERQFDQLQEDFRQQTSSAFSEAAQDLRQQARELDERQKEIARRLAGNPSPETGPREKDGENTQQSENGEADGPPSLRNERNDDALKEQLARQRDDLEKILEQSRQLIEQAEDSEPLLARRLFETLGDVEPREPAKALRAAELLVDRGLHQQAAEPEEAARRAITELREGVEAAAEAVLGSEVESLKQAKDTLDDLAEELSDEVEEQRAGSSQKAESEQQKAAGQWQTAEGGNQKAEGEGQRAGGGDSSGRVRQASDRSDQPDGSPAQSQSSILRSGGREGGSSAASGHRPLTGSDFRNWSDRLREVEELLEDNELRQQASRVRDRARAMRSDFHRHGTEPQWELVESELLDEMRNLQKRLAQEIAAAESDRSMVPIDREPLPEAFNELVQRYYELLGQERLNERPQEPAE